jgi:hypothetical protein
MSKCAYIIIIINNTIINNNNLTQVLGVSMWKILYSIEFLLFFSYYTLQNNYSMQ